MALGSGADPVPAQPEPVAPASPSADLAPVPDTGTMPAPRQDTLLDPPAAPQSPATEPTPDLPNPDLPAPDLPNPDLPAPDATPKAATVPAQDTAELAPLPQTPAPESEPQIPAEGPALVELGQAILPPAPGLSQGVVGVTTNRLPRIGDAAPDTAKDEVAEIADSRPIKAFARPFQPEADKPVFAILLRDIGAAGMDRAELTKLPFAVTFVIDPLAPDAAAAMAAYRAAGQEVAILAMLPQNATPSDLEQSFQSLALSLPESVAFVDAPKGGLQENRALAAQAIPILKAQGRGIVTYDRGLGAADQVARREGLATASIFRELDAEAEGTPAVRRYLDRAAFKAAQEGRVVVIGQTRPETVAAILEWLVEGRGATVSVAPLSAAMQGDE